jgi:hypothetical protein
VLGKDDRALAADLVWWDEKESWMEDKLKTFLELVPNANWRQPPAVWNEQIREALSDQLVTIGWGGVFKLTDRGRERLTLFPVYGSTPVED